jgi:hypothetical protein
LNVVNGLAPQRARRAGRVARLLIRSSCFAASALLMVGGASAPWVRASVVPPVQSDPPKFPISQILMPWDNHSQQWYGDNDKKPTISLTHTGDSNDNAPKYPSPKSPLPTGSDPVVGTGDNGNNSGCSSSCTCGCNQGGPCTCHRTPPTRMPPPTCNPTPPTVPEPATISLLGFASLLMLRRRSRA